VAALARPIGVRIAIVLLLGAHGCYRAVYTRLAPSPPAATAAPSSPRSSWRNFYLYGYLPSELVVDAAGECGGAARIREIRTRQTFTQGLIRMFASSSGVNAYAPWTAEVMCVDDPAP
jgi:hypothetical protein